MNACARLIFCAPKQCHITPLLQWLHWLPIRLRIEFKILLITFKVLQGSAPKYLIDLISVLPPSRYELRRNNKGILLSTPKRFTKATMLDRSFMAAALRLWNCLPAWDLFAPKVILNSNLRHFYSARHFVSTISFYLDFYIVFLQITFLITNWFQSDCK